MRYTHTGQPPACAGGAVPYRPTSPRSSWLDDRPSGWSSGNRSAFAVAHTAPIHSTEAQEFWNSDKAITTRAQRFDDAGISGEGLPARTTAVMGQHDRPRSDLGEDAPANRRYTGQRVVAGVHLPHDRRQAERGGGAQNQAIIITIGRAKHARGVAAESPDRLDRALKLTAHAAAGHEIGMGIGVIAQRITVAQLFMQGRPVARGDLIADHEKGRNRVVGLEHAHKAGGERIGTVVEAERDLFAAWTRRVGARGSLANAADRTI